VEVCWRWISQKTGIFWYLCLSSQSNDQSLCTSQSPRSRFLKIACNNTCSGYILVWFPLISCGCIQSSNKTFFLWWACQKSFEALDTHNLDRIEVVWSPFGPEWRILIKKALVVLREIHLADGGPERPSGRGETETSSRNTALSSTEEWSWQNRTTKAGTLGYQVSRTTEGEVCHVYSSPGFYFPSLGHASTVDLVVFFWLQLISLWRRRRKQFTRVVDGWYWQ
jgi:hypothetical protein